MYSPRQCYKFYSLGHVKKQCNSRSKSYKCSICGCDHSSLDRRCKTYRTVKREAANHAVELITNSKTNAKKKYLKDQAFNANHQNQSQTCTYSDAARNNRENEPATNKTKLLSIRKDINHLQNENKIQNKASKENKQHFEHGMSTLAKAIESTNTIAQKFDETIKSLTATIAQISRHECDLVRNEVDANLSHIKKEYTEYFNSNLERIDRIETHLRSLTSLSTYQPLSTTHFHHNQLQPTANLLREASNTLYRPATANLHTLQPISHYNHHHYDQQQAHANLKNTGNAR